MTTTAPTAWVAVLAAALSGCSNCAGVDSPVQRGYELASAVAPIDGCVDARESWVTLLTPPLGLSGLELEADRPIQGRTVHVRAGRMVCVSRGGETVGVLGSISLWIVDTRRGRVEKEVALPEEVAQHLGVGCIAPGPRDRAGSVWLAGGDFHAGTGLWCWSPDRGLECASSEIGAADRLVWDEARNELIAVGMRGNWREQVGHIDVVEGASGQLLRSFELPLRSARLGFSGVAAYGGRAWVSVSGASQVHEVDLMTGTTVATLEYDGADAVFVEGSADGRALVIVAQFRGPGGGGVERMEMDWFDVSESGLRKRGSRALRIHGPVNGVIPIRKLGAVLVLPSRCEDRVLVLGVSPADSLLSDAVGR